MCNDIPPLPYPIQLTDENYHPVANYKAKNGLDGLIDHLARALGAQYAELAFWIYLGDTPTLFQVACCSRANRYMAYVWCNECGAHVLDARRKLVTYPRDRVMASLIMCNDLCFKHAEENSREWTGPNPRTHYVLYGHPRTCVCPRCCVCKFHGYIMP